MNEFCYMRELLLQYELKSSRFFFLDACLVPYFDYLVLPSFVM